MITRSKDLLCVSVTDRMLLKHAKHPEAVFSHKFRRALCEVAQAMLDDGVPPHANLIFTIKAHAEWIEYPPMSDETDEP